MFRRWGRRVGRVLRGPAGDWLRPRGAARQGGEAGRCAAGTGRDD